jgi:hypothetical protein
MGSVLRGKVNVDIRDSVPDPQKDVLAYLARD